MPTRSLKVLKRGQVLSPRGTLAHTVRHTVPRDLFLVELLHAEWLAQFLRDKYHEGSLEWGAAYLISAQSDVEKTVLPLLRKSLEAVKELYSSPSIAVPRTAALHCTQRA